MLKYWIAIGYLAAGFITALDVVVNRHGFWKFGLHETKKTVIVKAIVAGIFWPIDEVVVIVKQQRIRRRRWDGKTPRDRQ